MAIFKTRAEAEAFSKEGPLILEGLVKSFAIKDTYWVGPSRFARGLACC
jgi:hypothetical protein